jgi:hypothetical protein
MEEFKELKKWQEFHVEIFTFNKKGDVVLTIDSGENDKTVLSGKAATKFIDLVDDYLNELHKKGKESK